MTIKLSHLAQKDLDEIRRYTLEQWSRDQWFKYFLGFASTFESITEYPERNMPALVYYEDLDG